MATAKPRAGEGGVRSNEKCVGAGKRRGSSNSDNSGGNSGGGGGKGVSRIHSPDITDGSGPVRKGTSSPESKNDVMRRFDAEVRKLKQSPLLCNMFRSFRSAGWCLVRTIGIGIGGVGRV